MKFRKYLTILAALIACATIPALACAGDSNDRHTLPGGQGAPTVSGTVSYHERLALTPGATLIVELRDASYADSPAQLVASQTITGPGQVPIKFDVPYDPGDIDSDGRYSITARIKESDGRLAFINDTAYDVLTQGNPNRVEMLLVLVEPPPDLVASIGGSGEDWRTWVEAPADVIWANIIPNEQVPLLRIAYFQSALENCVRPGRQNVSLEGRDIIVRLTIRRPPQTPWAIPCDEQVDELDTVLHMGTTLSPGAPYRVIVNDVVTAQFSIPSTRLGHTAIFESPIQSAEIVQAKSASEEHVLHVVTGLPKGSGCSQVNGYEIRRISARNLDVVVTHHEVTDPSVVCTADFPIIELDIPLGPNLESGAEYTISVNGGTSLPFVLR